MIDFKLHWSISKYGSSSIKDKDKSPLINLLKVKQIPFTIDIVASIITILTKLYFKKSLLYSILVGAIFHICLVFFLATVSIILENNWKNRKKSKILLFSTFKRFKIT